MTLLALIAGTATTAVLAQDSAEVQPDEPPIDIYAVESYYDLRAGVTRFENNVSITRGAMQVEADRGVLRQADGEIAEVELEGAPISWRDQLSDGSIVTGESRAMHYDVPANVVTLTGNAVIRHMQGEFTGDELVYDLNAESLAGRSTGDERVRVVIEPEAMSDPRPAPATPPGNDNPAPPADGAAENASAPEQSAGAPTDGASTPVDSVEEIEADPEPPVSDPSPEPDGR